MKDWTELYEPEERVRDITSTMQGVRQEWIAEQAEVELELAESVIERRVERGQLIPTENGYRTNPYWLAYDELKHIFNEMQIQEHLDQNQTLNDL